MADDQLYDIKNFSPILEIKGNNDHAKLIQMLDDVNNYDIPIEQTFEKYFNEDNFFTWMAYNILVGNIDTQSQNFYLYSPHNGNKWYFLPWDYDGTFPLQGRTDLAVHQYAPWANGVSNYWGAVLPNRVLRVAAYRKMLDDKINELRGFLTPERIKGMLDEYRKTVDPYLLRNPDLNYIQLASSLEIRNQVLDSLPGDIQNNYDLYLESLKKPMPFFLDTPKVVANQLFFQWGESYDFGGQDVTYTFEISQDVDFKNVKKIVAQTKLTNLTDFQMQMLKPGTYYWRVISENQAGKTQIPFDIYYDTNAQDHYGIKIFTITADGQVIE
jgi:spore coat protein H